MRGTWRTKAEKKKTPDTADLLHQLVIAVNFYFDDFVDDWDEPLAFRVLSEACELLVDNTQASWFQGDDELDAAADVEADVDVEDVEA